MGPGFCAICSSAWSLSLQSGLTALLIRQFSCPLVTCYLLTPACDGGYSVARVVELRVVASRHHPTSRGAAPGRRRVRPHAYHQWSPCTQLAGVECLVEVSACTGQSVHGSAGRCWRVGRGSGSGVCGAPPAGPAGNTRVVVIPDAPGHCGPYRGLSLLHP